MDNISLSLGADKTMKLLRQALEWSAHEQDQPIDTLMSETGHSRRLDPTRTASGLPR
jgi:hypothetical protein